ncbi:MAG: replication-associated recombination protein A, partial [Desulfovibrio sp.]|nr:replication-associated recombination protein A [Desulfovibrio sp.]
QLLSRLHVLRLRPLGRAELTELARRGAKATGLNLADDVADLLAGAAHGDARTLLNLVEYVAALPDDSRDAEHVRAALPEVLIRHDKDGDSHYELASALIKSIRGSDVDAALYWLACLLEGGEDPRFVCRRLILSASEDVGLADPAALRLAVACQQAVEFVGMPEGFIPLAETVTYLAMARKSNSAYAGYLNAQREIKLNGARPVPLHLRNPSTQMQKEWGYGKDYKYPHNYPESWIEQSYLPPELEGRRFYQPRDNGEEPRLSQWWRKIHNIKKPDE